MRIFFDANIIFSACNKNSFIAELAKIIDNAHEIISCEYALEEATRNLADKKPEWFKNLPSIISRIAIKTSHDSKVEADINIKDRIILASAIHYKCEVLITGDKKHFSHLYDKIISGTKILSPAMAFEQLI